MVVKKITLISFLTWIPIAKVNKLYDAGHTIKYMTALVLVVELTTDHQQKNNLLNGEQNISELDVGNKPSL